MPLDLQFVGAPIFPEDPETEAELLEEYARESAEEFFDVILDAFPGWQVPPMKKLPARDRLARYMQNTVRSDLDYLMDPQYTEKYKRGEVPAVASPFWLNLLSLPVVFKAVASDFRRVARDRVRRDERQAEPVQELGY